jgi:hypothetical protein
MLEIFLVKAKGGGDFPLATTPWEVKASLNVQLYKKKTGPVVCRTNFRKKSDPGQSGQPKIQGRFLPSATVLTIGYRHGEFTESEPFRSSPPAIESTCIIASYIDDER